ncbi:hypothetical protein HZS_7183 [Henneguya salminicola]|nr:hypothetical protein HZS_7183 [Henneguya salminicola]
MKLFKKKEIKVAIKTKILKCKIKKSFIGEKLILIYIPTPCIKATKYLSVPSETKFHSTLRKRSDIINLFRLRPIPNFVPSLHSFLQIY